MFLTGTKLWHTAQSSPSRLAKVTGTAIRSESTPSPSIAKISSRAWWQVASTLSTHTHTHTKKKLLLRARDSTLIAVTVNSQSNTRKDKKDFCNTRRLNKSAKSETEILENSIYIYAVDHLYSKLTKRHFVLANKCIRFAFLSFVWPLSGIVKAV